MRRTASLLSACAAVAVLLPSAAHGWGFAAHQYITARAIALLPAAIRPFFLKYETTVVEHSIDPDTYRTMGWIEEPPRHFVDMDAYGPFPFAELPHDYDAAVAKYGKEFVEKNGLLPWRLQQVHDWLTEAFKQQTPYARDNIKLFAAVLSHYLADAYQPLHATTNYDGQLTEQYGVHARFESALFERFQPRLTINPEPAKPIARPRDAAFDVLLSSYQLVPSLLDADKAAIAGKDVYDDAYFEAFFRGVRPLLQRRIAESITATASIIVGAWQEAGKPPVKTEMPRPVQKVRPPRSR